MTKRERILAQIRTAGANGDYHAYSRLYVENRIPQLIAKTEFEKGVAFAALKKEAEVKANG